VGGCATFGCQGAGEGPPDLSELETLAQVPLPKALIIRSVLASSGIPSLIEGEHASTFGFPLAGVAGFAKVLVKESQRKAAREALAFEGIEGVELGWDIGEEP
jgi:hypothetical protein